MLVVFFYCLDSFRTAKIAFHLEGVIDIVTFSAAQFASKNTTPLHFSFVLLLQGLAFFIPLYMILSFLDVSFIIPSVLYLNRKFSSDLYGTSE
jgi:hypothetical protein